MQLHEGCAHKYDLYSVSINVSLHHEQPLTNDKIL